MNTSGFDGLVVNHGGLDEMSQYLGRAVADIDERMNHLEKDLAPLRAEWSGQAQRAYQSAKSEWDTAIAQMKQLLAETSATVVQSNQDYRAADLRGARQFDLR